MQRAISSTLLAIVSVAQVGCGTLLPESSVSADPSVSWSDVREIERLLPVVGIRHPIAGISRIDAERYSVMCNGSHFNDIEYEQIYFTAYHRNGRWFADKSSIRRSIGVMVD